MITLTHYLILAALLFFIGLFGALSRRNAIAVLMSIELMLNAVNINLVAFARFQSTPLALGQVFALCVITVTAAEVAVGLAIILAIYRRLKTVKLEDLNLMKW